MMFIIKQKEINNILKNISSIVEQRSLTEGSNKLIDSLYFNVNKSGITLIASSTDIQVKSYIKGDFSKDEFIFCVNAKYLADSVDTLPPLLDITFTQDDKNIIISCGKTKYTLTNLLADDQEYPILNLENKEVLFSLNSDAFRKAIQSVSFAMGSNHLRYYLSGVLIRVFEQKIAFVATDTHRMSYYSISDNNIGETDKSIIIPKKTINFLERFLANFSENIEVSLAKDDFVVIKNNNYEIISKLIIGAYPEYEKVLTQKHDHEIKVDTHNFKEALNRIAVMATDKFRTVNLGIEKNNLIIESKTAVNETAKTETEMKYEGKEITINFNVQYIVEVLNKIDEKETKVQFIDQNSSVIFTFTGNDNYKYVLMPLRV